MQHEDEGLVEFEVTAAEHEPTVTSNTQSSVTTHNPITVMTQNSADVQPVSTIQIQHSEHPESEKMEAAVARSMLIYVFLLVSIVKSQIYESGQKNFRPIFVNMFNPLSLIILIIILEFGEHMNTD